MLFIKTNNIMKDHSLYKYYKGTLIYTNTTVLVEELKKGERSGFVKGFNRDRLLRNLHQEHIAK